MPMVGFPLLLIPVAIYNMIVFLMPGVTMVEPITRLKLLSGAEWSLTLSDMLLALGIVLLMFEVIKGARPGAKYVTDHLLSLIVFGAAAAEFVQWPRFGNTTFFLLALLALVDFLCGIALRARRRMTMAEVPSRHDPRPANTTEPQFEPVVPLPPATAVAAPAPAAIPAVQAAASIAEAVLLDRPEPKFVSAEVTPSGSSPQVLSPGLQPVEGLVASPDSSSR